MHPKFILWNNAIKFHFRISFEIHVASFISIKLVVIARIWAERKKEVVTPFALSSATANGWFFSPLFWWLFGFAVAIVCSKNLLMKRITEIQRKANRKKGTKRRKNSQRNNRHFIWCFSSYISSPFIRSIAEIRDYIAENQYLISAAKRENHKPNFSLLHSLYIYDIRCVWVKKSRRDDNNINWKRRNKNCHEIMLEKKHRNRFCHIAWVLCVQFHYFMFDLMA